MPTGRYIELRKVQFTSKNCEIRVITLDEIERILI
jgi:hypothetical protein